MLADIFRKAVIWSRHGDEWLTAVVRTSLRPPLPRSHLLDPLFDLADARQILVELRLVAAADLPAQCRRMLLHPIEHTLVSPAAAIVEQAIKRQRRIDFHWHRRSRILP